MSPDDEDNGYKIDSNFINYSELYKSPGDLKQDSKYLINHYADALIKGGSPDVYTDSPSLVGNRYFISTNSNCLDNDDKVQIRSVLIDNVNASAMETSNDKNKGLIYSLLTSLKSLNTSDMFNDMEDGNPKEYINDNIDYLNNSELPKCKEVTVHSSDKKDASVSGWITEEDATEIGPRYRNPRHLHPAQ